MERTKNDLEVSDDARYIANNVLYTIRQHPNLELESLITFESYRSPGYNETDRDALTTKVWDILDRLTTPAK